MCAKMAGRPLNCRSSSLNISLNGPLNLSESVVTISRSSIEHRKTEFTLMVTEYTF